jgi:hypothetical protein
MVGGQAAGQVLRLTHAHRAGRWNHKKVLWSALMLALWRRHYN